MKKKSFIKTFVAICTTVFVISLFSCATTQKNAATVEETARMFWTINGTDSAGNPSKVYILGTIHVGDEEIANLPSEIDQAFASADRYVAEISSADMKRLQQETIKLVANSIIKAGGKNIIDYLDDDEIDMLESMFGDAFYNFTYLEPWALTSTISIMQYATSGLTAEYGLDNNLMAELESDDIEWEGLDSLKTQMDILSFGTYDEQLYMLKDTIDSIIDPTEINQYINKLYQAYLAGDSEAVGQLEEDEEFNKETDPKMQKFLESYMKAVFIDRNEAWAKKIANYLKQGGNTFIFAGCGHFSGDNSVFKFLKKNGTIN